MSSPTILIRSVSITTNPFGETTDIRLDPPGLNIYSQWTYDDAGRISTFIDPTGATTTWEHDELGRVSKLTLPGGATWQYTYDVVGRRIEQTMPSGTRVTQTLNANGQPSKLECTAVAGVDPVPPHDFVYDVLGRLVRAKLPAGAVERRYDSVGRLIQETAQGETIRLSYDDVSGDVDLEFPDGRCERTHHDPTGRPTSVTLQTPGAALGGIAGEVLAAIEFAGHPTKIAHSNGIETTLTYDRPGRLVSMKHSRAGVLLDGYRARYDERNRRAVVQLTGNPTRSTLHDFDARDRLTQARWGFPLQPLPEIAALADHTTAITAAKAAATAVAATTTETYVLDQADARRQRTRTAGGAAPSVGINVLGPDHRIVTADGNPITHHPDGARATDTHQHYDIDALGRVVRVHDATTGAVTAEFAYDALSRVAAGSLTGTAFMHWFLGTTWIQEARGVGEIRQATPHPLWSQPLSVTDSADTLFIHPDEGLSTLCVTDAAGTVRERHRYGPFGAPELFAGDGVTSLAPVNAASEPRWRGMPLNSAIGLYTSRERLYDPDLGVFLEPDPLLYLDSPSPWVYATHNPIDFADPTGYGKTSIGHDNVDGNGAPKPESPYLNPGGAGIVISKLNRPGLVLRVPDTYDFVKLRAYQRGIIDERIGRNGGSEAPTGNRRGTPKQEWAKSEFWRRQNSRRFWKLPEFSPSGKQWHADHIIELQHDLWGTSGDFPEDYRAQEGSLNEQEGRQSFPLQKDNPFGVPARAVVRASEANRWYNSPFLRKSSNYAGKAATLYGVVQSGIYIGEAVLADVHQGTAGEQTLAAVAHEAGGWVGAVAGASEAAPLGAICGPAAWFCIPVAGLAGGLAGYLVVSSAVDTTVYVGKIGVDAVVR